MPEPTRSNMAASNLGIVVYGRGHADYINEDLNFMVKNFNVQVRRVSNAFSSATRS